MLDDWKINWQWHDLPPEVWDFPEICANSSR